MRRQACKDNGRARIAQRLASRACEHLNICTNTLRKLDGLPRQRAMSTLEARVSSSSHCARKPRKLHRARRIAARAEYRSAPLSIASRINIKPCCERVLTLASRFCAVLGLLGAGWGCESRTRSLQPLNGGPRFEAALARRLSRLPAFIEFAFCPLCRRRRVLGARVSSAVRAAQVRETAQLLIARSRFTPICISSSPPSRQNSTPAPSSSSFVQKVSRDCDSKRIARTDARGASLLS